MSTEGRGEDGRLRVRFMSSSSCLFKSAQRSSPSSWISPLGSWDGVGEDVEVDGKGKENKSTSVWSSSLSTLTLPDLSCLRFMKT